MQVRLRRFPPSMRMDSADLMAMTEGISDPGKPDSQLRVSRRRWAMRL